MADYDTCWLKIPEECKEQVEQIVSLNYQYNCYLVHNNLRISEYTFVEVKRGELDFLDDLHEQGIPFNFHNDNSDPDDRRFVRCRFTSDGEMILQDYFESETKISAEAFLYEIDKCTSPDEKLVYINKQYIRFSNLLISLPWNNQVEYGKIYRMRRLVEPS